MKFKDVILFSIAILVIGVISYGGWHLQRAWNYSWSYKEYVQAEVCVMVKPEHLTVEAQQVCKG